MRLKDRRNWAVAVAGAVLVLLLCILSGCGTIQSTSQTGEQPPGQGQEAQTEPGQKQEQPETPQNGEPKAVKPERTLPILQNANFEMGHYGWSPQDGTIITEEDGNKCMSVGYTWGLFQFMQVTPGKTYQIYCKVRQGNEPISPARICIIFYDTDHKIMPESLDIINNTDTEWRGISKKVFTVPEEALFTKMFLLSNGKGTVCFDNISVSLAPQ